MSDSSEDEFRHLEECRDSYDQAQPFKIVKCTCDEVRETPDKKCLAHKRKLISRVWKFYSLMGNKTAKCNFCENIFSYHSTVSNLKKHLMRTHRSQVISNFPPEPPSNPDLRSPLAKYIGEAKFSSDDSCDKCTCNDVQGVDKKCPVHSRRPRRSLIWQFYIIKGKKTAKCKLCGNILSYHSTVSNLKKHLMRTHRSQVITTLTQDDTKQPERSLAAYVRQFSSNDIDESPEVSVEESAIKEDCASGGEDYFPNTEEGEVVQNEEGRIQDVAEPNNEVMLEETYLDEDILQDDTPNFETISISQAPMKYALSRGEWESSIERFGTYVVSLMKLLPRGKAARFQVQIIDRLIKETCVQK